MATIDYFLALNSPWSYMSGARLGAIAERAGARLNVKPVKLSDLFAATGGVALPKRAPARQAYRLAELRRWRDFLNIPIVIEPAPFPADETLAGCAVAAAADEGSDALGLAVRIGRALWEEERDIADETVVRDAAGDAGFDADALLARAKDPACAAKLDENTQQAITAGVFGVPSFVIDGEVFWGQDRLDFVARALGVEP